MSGPELRTCSQCGSQQPEGDFCERCGGKLVWPVGLAGGAVGAATGAAAASVAPPTPQPAPAQVAAAYPPPPSAAPAGGSYPPPPAATGGQFPPPGQFPSPGRYPPSPGQGQPYAPVPQSPFGGGPGGYGGPPQGAFGGGRPRDGFFASLFDLSFHHFVTPKIIKVLFILALVGIGLGMLAMIIAGFSRGVGTGILFVVLAPIAGFIYVLFARLWLEVVVVLFRIEEHTGAMAEQAGK